MLDEGLCAVSLGVGCRVGFEISKVRFSSIVARSRSRERLQTAAPAAKSAAPSPIAGKMTRAGLANVPATHVPSFIEIIDRPG